MGETSSSSEPATGPVATAPQPAEPPAVVTEPRLNGRLNAVVVIALACGLFHPWFAREVVLPFLDVIGAN